MQLTEGWSTCSVVRRTAPASTQDGVKQEEGEGAAHVEGIHALVSLSGGYCSDDGHYYL